MPNSNRNKARHSNLFFLFLLTILGGFGFIVLSKLFKGASFGSGSSSEGSLITHDPALAALEDESTTQITPMPRASRPQHIDYFQLINSRKAPFNPFIEGTDDCNVGLFPNSTCSAHNQTCIQFGEELASQDMMLTRLSDGNYFQMYQLKFNGTIYGKIGAKEFLIASQGTPISTVSSNGTVLVSWSVMTGPDTAQNYAQLYRNDGTLYGKPLELDPHCAGTEPYTRFISLTNGDIAHVCMHSEPAHWRSWYAQTCNSNTQECGEPVKVSKKDIDCAFTSAAPLANGEFVVVQQPDDYQSSINAIIFSSDAKIKYETEISSNVTSCGMTRLTNLNDRPTVIDLGGQKLLAVFCKQTFDKYSADTLLGQVVSYNGEKIGNLFTLFSIDFFDFQHYVSDVMTAKLSNEKFLLAFVYNEYTKYNSHLNLIMQPFHVDGRPADKQQSIILKVDRNSPFQEGQFLPFYLRSIIDIGNNTFILNDKFLWCNDSCPDCGHQGYASKFSISLLPEPQPAPPNYYLISGLIGAGEFLLFATYICCAKICKKQDAIDYEYEDVSRSTATFFGQRSVNAQKSYRTFPSIPDLERAETQYRLEKGESCAML